MAEEVKFRYEDTLFIVDKYKNDPIGFIYQILQVKKLDDWQEQFITHMFKEKYVSIASGRSVGKTYAAICFSLWWLCTRPEPLIVFTANTKNQVEQGMMKECSIIAQGSRIAHWFDITATKICLQGNTNSRIICVTQNKDNPDAVKAYRTQDFNMVIVDEASGMNENVFMAFLGNLTTPASKMVMLGQPNRHGTAFHGTFLDRPNKRWVNLNIDSRNTSWGMRDGGIWIDEIINRYGIDSEKFRVDVMGQFPTLDNSNTLISKEELMKCFDMDLPPDSYKYEKIIFGLDVARQGSDYSALTIRQGRKIHKMFRFKYKDSYDLCQKVVELFKQWNADLIVVDSVGMGGPVCDILRRLTDYSKIIEHNGSSTASEPMQFYNKRSETWTKGLEKLKSGVDLPREFMADLENEIVNVVYFINKRTQTVQIESKDDMKARNGGDSPDLTDSLLLALYVETFEEKPREFDISKISPEEICRKLFGNSYGGRGQYGWESN